MYDPAPEPQSTTTFKLAFLKNYKPSKIPKELFEIDSKKGLYDSEASNKFRKTPPSGDNFVEIINYKKFQIEELEDKIKSLSSKLSDINKKKETLSKISTLKNLALSPNLLLTPSNTGPNILQGPHQVAEKSTTTTPLVFSTLSTNSFPFIALTIFNSSNLYFLHFYTVCNFIICL